MSKLGKHLVFYVTAYMKNGDVWQTKRGTQQEVDEYFGLFWADKEVLKITVEEKMEALNLTKPEHIL